MFVSGYERDDAVDAFYESQRLALQRALQIQPHEGPDNEEQFFQSLNAVEVSDQAGQYDSLYDQSKRHALKSAVIDFQHEGRDDNEARFFQYLNAFEVSDQALLELEEHGFQKSSLPPGEFDKRFPLGSQVNKYESTTAWAYTQGTELAHKMNELMQEHEWSSLFKAYGHCVKALYSYGDKMNALYGKRKTLYRGLLGSWEQTQEEYNVGKQFTWASFTSVSENRNIAIDFANGKYYNEGHGRPILFEISTLSRGAPLISWSQHPLEDEILFQPFQGFEVVGRLCFSDMLLVQLQTVLLEKSQNRSPKIQVPHHHYARSSAKSYLEMRVNGGLGRFDMAVMMLMQPV